MDKFRTAVLDEIRQTLRGVDEAAIKNLVQSILGANTIFIHGQRREDIPCEGFCMRLNHLGLKAFHIGDPCTPPIKFGDLLILSCADGLHADESYLQAAKEVKAGIALIGTTAREEDGEVFVLVPGTRKSVQPGGALYEQTLWLLFDWCEYMLQEHVGGDEKQRVARHANVL